MSDVSQVEIFI